MGLGHSERRHSKFSASGAERWTQCPGSIALSEGVPDKSSPWAEEGTKAHEVLEALLKIEMSGNCGTTIEETRGIIDAAPIDMLGICQSTASFLTSYHESNPDSEFLVETRIHLDFIHPEMFGTFDSAIVDHFGTLHVFDFKYGAGHAVSPKGNLQMIFYGLGLAHKYDYNFKRVRLWIVQPRIRGYDGPAFWEIPTLELMKYADFFRAAVERAELFPNEYKEGAHCHWCKAKAICPLKRTTKLENAKSIFSSKPIGVLNGKEESKEKSSLKETARTREAKIQARIEKAFGQGEGSGEQNFY